MPRLGLLAVAALFPALGSLAPASAQAYLGFDATLASPYVWRGVTRANGSVVQPEAFASLQAAGGFLSAGAWASYELGDAGVNDLSDLGVGHAGLTELNYWGQAAWSLGILETALGGIRYTFRGTAPTAGRTRADNTTEVFASVRATSKYVVPGLALWVDVDRVRGAYVEGSVTVPLLANPLAKPFLAVITRATMGYTLGQEASTTDPGQGAYFTRAGVTHFDLSAASDVTLRPLRVPTML